MILIVTNQRPFEGGLVTALLYFREKVFSIHRDKTCFRRTVSFGKNSFGELLAEEKSEAGKYSSRSSRYHSTRPGSISLEYTINI